VDILAPLVRELNERGYDVRCVDATSEADLGERFEVVFLGDILEHVTDPLGLLRFAGRHTEADGRIIATTPNPFSRKFLRRFRRDGAVVVNLDHVAWITPTMAMELARRAGMELRCYHLVKRMSRVQRALRRIAWRFTPAEFSFPDYIYEFGVDRSA
jgi:2-polyprenyl-3-methyl-5-hydroxy-6-metoxy-1,4-benzoquinol methylase